MDLRRLGSSQLCWWRNEKSREEYTENHPFQHVNCHSKPYIILMTLELTSAINFRFSFCWQTYPILSYSIRYSFIYIQIARTYRNTEEETVGLSNTVALDFGRALFGSAGGAIFAFMVAFSCFWALNGT